MHIRSLPLDFYQGYDTLNLAKNLLGKVLVRKKADGILAGIINEVEAYTPDDPASHSFGNNKTPRNASMFLSAGHAYVYTIYGIHHCFNITSQEEGYGAAVLIRSVVPYLGFDNIQNSKNVTNGPAKLCRFFDINKDYDGVYLVDNPNLFIGDIGYTVDTIYNGPRIGISKGTDRLRRWRCTIS